MFDMQHIDTPQPTPAYAQVAGPLDRPPVLPLRTAPTCTPSDDDEVVVCARDQSAYRLHPLPPLPPPDGFLTRPLRVQIAPGVSVGFLPGGGFGVKAGFGPGVKSGDPAQIPPSSSDSNVALPPALVVSTDTARSAQNR